MFQLLPEVNSLNGVVLRYPCLVSGKPASKEGGLSSYCFEAKLDYIELTWFYLKCPRLLLERREAPHLNHLLRARKVTRNETRAK